MSRRYRVKRVCPDCGLLVASTTEGELRPHARLAQAADVDAPCAAPVNPSRRDASAPVRVADQYREQTTERLAAERAARLDPDSRLPSHLRGDAPV